MGMLLSVNHLGKVYTVPHAASFAAVADVSFDVAAGHIVGFPGPNGAGKTTTIKMLLGLITVGDMGFGIAEEAENGTLEQLFLSPLGPLRLFLMRAVITLGTSLVFIICVLIGILLLTGIRLRLELVQLIPFSLALLVALALGLLVANLAIVFKRVSQALSIIQFGFVFLLMIPFDTSGPLLAFVGHFVPLVPMFSLLRQMLHHPAGFAGGGLLLFWSMVNTLVWLLVGLITFQQATNAARHHGTIGHY